YLLSCTISCSVLSLYLVSLRLPRSTLFPYTTLFRSGRRAVHHHQVPAAVLGLIDHRRQADELFESGHHGQFLRIDHPRRLCAAEDRKSTRLNSSHVSISYAVFCLKKKKVRNIT